jgi:polyisoprenoid-binding protein YceI
MSRTLLAVVVLALAVAPIAARSSAGVQTLTLDPNEWTIDANHSAAHFAVKHMLVSTVRGQLGKVTGKVWYDGTNVSSIRAEATIDVKAISSGNDARDRDLRGEEFFAVEKYPTATFKSKRVEPGAAGKFKLVGDLTIRTTTKEVTLDVEGPSPILTVQGAKRTAATATVTINRFDYGLRWNQLIEAGPVVAADVVITIDLEAVRR